MRKTERGREREASRGEEEDKGGPTAGVRYACASAHQVEEGECRGSIVGWFRRLADGGGCDGGGSSCCRRGLPMVAEGDVGAGGEGGRRLPHRVVNLSAALRRRRRGRYYFLLLLLFSFSFSFTFQHVFARSLVVLVAPSSSFRFLFQVSFLFSLSLFLSFPCIIPSFGSS